MIIPCSVASVPRRLLLATLLVWIYSAAAAEPAVDPAQGFFDQTFGDFAEELANAKAQGKKGVLLMFEMNECPFCQRMKTTVLNRPEVQTFYKQHFLIFAVDVEGDVDVTDFAGRAKPQKDLALKDYRVRATPVFAFFDLDGQPLAKYIGATKDAEEFMWLGEYVVQDRYKEIPFAKYKRERQAAAPNTGTPG